jgi:hypothetical protein
MLDLFCLLFASVYDAVCPGWIIGSLQALAGATPGHVVAGT